jgi:hypothetical protein
LKKLLLSAIKIGNQNEVNIEDLATFVETIMVDGGRQLKRLRPAPQGRGYRIRKRSNHVTLVVDGKNVEPQTSVRNGTKANPIGLRLGIVRVGTHNWYGGNKYADKLVGDEESRKYLSARIAKGGVS